MSTCPHCGNAIEQELRVTLDVGPHLSHLFKRLFPKDVSTKLDELLKGQEKIMADLQAEFAALGTAFDSLSSAIDKEIQQVLDAVNSGGVSAAVVEDARTRINALTTAVSDKIAALAADDPTPAP